MTESVIAAEQDSARVTTAHVAEAASVSRVTVSRVLNNHNNVSERVRERVLRAAAEVGYLKHPRGLIPGQGAGYPSGRTAPGLHDVGFFFTSVIGEEQVSSNPFWSLVLHGAETEASSLGLRLTYRSINPWIDQPSHLTELVRSSRLDGILLVGPATEVVARAFLSAEQRMVLVDNAMPGVAVDAVASDNFGGGRTAAKHLLERGHREIAFIGGPLQTSRAPLLHRTNTVWSIEQRAQGYRFALREAGIEPDPRLQEGDSLTTAGGYAACQRLMAGGRLFTALFCANDETAIGAIRALHEAGLAVPTAVSVIGFDDIEVAQHLIPPLTTIRVDKEAIGTWSVRRLLDRALSPDAVTTTTMLHAPLIARGTVAAAG